MGLPHSDGNTLFLNVTERGSKSRRRVTVDGRRRIGLGPFPTVSLAEAPRRAPANRHAVANGHHPLPDQKRAFPVIGKMRVDRIRREDVLRIRQPVWTVHPDVARKLRQRIRATLKWCQAHGYVKQNVAGEAIDGALPAMPTEDASKTAAFAAHWNWGDRKMKLRKSSVFCSTLCSIHAWFTRVAGVAIGLALLGTGVAYAEDGQMQPGIVEEIVVTASKREEGLMDVAQSIQYLSGEELEASGVQNVAQIVQLIPGVSLPTGVASTRRYNVRGTGAVRTNDSAVGFYIDGMPHYIVDLPFGPDAEVFDLESIQVLRGPQGTLYGQGAQGGTILITTAQPDLEKFRARVRAGASRMREGGDGHTYDASISVPLIAGTLAASLTAGASQDPGLAEGMDLPGSDLDEDDRWYARIKVLWEPSDELSVTGLIQQRDLDESQHRGTYASVDPPLLGNTGGIAGGTDTELDLFGLNIEWDAGFATLTSSSSYMTYEYLHSSGFSFFDPNLGNFLVSYTADRDDVKTFNQELRLTSNGDGDWDWITGVSYTRGEHPNSSVINYLEPPAFAGMAKDQVLTESTQMAWFGEVSRSLMDGLITPLIGLRYFRDDRDKEIISTFEAYGFVFPLDNVDEDERFSLISPRFNLRITPSEETMFFLNISRGFRSGTFNAPGVVAAVGVLGIPLDVTVPESTVWSYEVGGRFSLFDDSLLIEPSLYLADYEDYQFSGTLAGSVVRIGIEEVKANGVELVLQWNTLVEGLSLSIIGSASSTKVEAIDAAADALLQGLKDGNQLPNVPEWDFRFGADYQRPVMGDWTAYASAFYFRRDGQSDFSTPLTSPVVSDLSLRLALANQNWRATLWGRNLTDDEGPASISGGSLLYRWDRRSAGVTLEYTFD